MTESIVGAIGQSEACQGNTALQRKEAFEEQLQRNVSPYPSCDPSSTLLSEPRHTPQTPMNDWP